MAQGIIKGPKKKEILRRILKLLKELYSLEINEKDLKINLEKVEKEKDPKGTMKELKIDDSLYSGRITITRDDVTPGNKDHMFTYLSDTKLKRDKEYEFKNYADVAIGAKTIRVALGPFTRV